MTSDTRVHFSVRQARDTSCMASDTRVHFNVRHARDTRVHFSVRQAPATSYTHGQWHSCTFQCATGAWHFLHPWPVTLVYISVCGVRLPLLATNDSPTFQRVWQQTRQIRDELIEISRYRSTNCYASVIACCMLGNLPELRCFLWTFLLVLSAII